MTNSNHLRIIFVEDLPSDVDLAIVKLRNELWLPVAMGIWVSR